MPKALARARAAKAAAAVVIGAVSLSGCAAPPRIQHVPAPAAAVAGQPAAAGENPGAVAVRSRVRNADNGRLEAVVPDMGKTALLIGDSQSEPSDGWPRQGLAAAGYKVYYCGRSGTGFVAGNGRTGNYIDALLEEDWLLPAGTPALIVIQGGGNDASTGATDARIRENAERLLAEVRHRYPDVRVAMIGTLARGASDGGGRRSEVDALVGSVAAAHDLPFVSVGDWLTRYNLAKDLADAVHMNPDGRRSLGKLLEARLRGLGLELKPTADPDGVPLLAAGSGGASGAVQD